MNENERMRNALTEILNLAYVITGDSDMSDTKMPLDWLIAKCKEGLKSQEEPNGGLNAVRAKLTNMENSQTGNNVAELREALEILYEQIWEWFMQNKITLRECKENRGIIRKALVIPRRNCDVGTAEEQAERFMDFCRPGNRPPNCEECKVYPKRMNKFWCQLEWAQMPYAEKRKSEERDYETYLRLKEKFDKNQGEKQWP